MTIFKGVVQKGARRGAELGFPTANVPLADDSLSGVYAARVSVGGGAPLEAAVFADRERMILEAHILDFSGDLYGQAITIELFKKIREDKEFENDDALREAIAEDIRAVRAHFA